MIMVCLKRYNFWSVADNVRFGGALMAVEVAEKLVQEQFTDERPKVLM